MLGVTGVVYRLADDVIVSSPSSTGNVEGDFAKESVLRVLVNHLFCVIWYFYGRVAHDGASTMENRGRGGLGLTEAAQTGSSPCAS